MRRLSQLSSSSRRGFALVIALVLMGFMVVLLLSLGSMTQVQTQVATVETTVEQARQNALLGIKAAIARLEDLTLDDTVATAPASQFMAPPSNLPSRPAASAPSNAQVGNENWVGVWSSSKADWTPTDPTKRVFKGWLVSNKNFDTPAAANTAATSSNGVLLFKGDALSGSSATNGDVYLTPVALDGTQANGSDAKNKYAFWIADESLKASIGLYDAWGANAVANTPGTGAKASQVIRNIPQKNDQNRISTLSSGNFDSADWETLLGKTLTWNDMGNILSIGVSDVNWQNLGRKRHDITYNSRGLLTNPRDGGWKKDLSVAFGTDTIFDAELAKKRVFDKEDYEGSYRKANKSFYGPRWEALRSFYLYHKDTKMGENNNAFEWDFYGPRVRLSGTYEFISESDETSAKDGFWHHMLGPDYRHTAGTKDVMDTFGGWATRDTPIKTSKGNEYVELLNSPVSPVMTYQAFIYKLTAIPAAPPAGSPPGTPPSGYTLRFGVTPVFHLWNPYNVKMDVRRDTITFRSDISPSFAIRKDGSSENITMVNPNFLKGNQPKDPFTVIELLNANAKDDNQVAYRFANSSVPYVLEPGQIGVSSLAAKIAANVTAAGTGNYVTSLMVNEYKPVGEFYFEGTAFSNEVFAAGDTVEIIISPPKSGRAYYSQLSAGSGQRRFGQIEHIYFDTSAPGVPITFPISALTSGVEIGYLEVYLAPADEMAPDNRKVLAQYNPAAPFKGPQGGEGKNSPMIKTNHGAGAYPSAVTNTGKNGYWGDSKQASGSSNILLYDIPRAPLHSIGQLQNANISPFETMPAYAIGNSYAPDRVDQSYVVDVADNVTQIDYSWLLNSALWDDYYFSTIPPSGENIPTTDSEQLTINYINAGKTLPNSRYSIFLRDQQNLNNLYKFDTNASELIVEGAFNVNSTSVDAWKAVLASLPERAFSIAGGPSVGAGDLKVPFFRHGTPKAKEGENWRAGWTNAESKLDDLAQDIVDQVKQRGPFMSVADFVNRRLDSGDLGKVGALQAAIDESGINGSKESLIPGALSQGDILSAIGPFLTTRGDTFMIRAYGSNSQPGQTTPAAQAWVEAVVRRVPDRQDITKRRFVIESLRWLNENEL